MAALHGRKGWIELTGGAMLHMVGWTLEQSTELFETTELAAGGSSPTLKTWGGSGLKEAKGTVSIMLDSATPTLDAGNSAITSAVFECDGLETPGRKFTVSGIGIHKVGHVFNRNEEQVGTYEWVATGDMVVA